MKRRTKGNGYLLKRGSTYSLVYNEPQADGSKKRRTIALRTDAGDPCRNKRDAEKAAEKHMELFVAKDAKATAERLGNRIADEETKIVRLIEESRQQTPLNQLWRTFEQKAPGIKTRAGKRFKAGPSTIESYTAYTKRLVEWLGTQYPELRTAQQVIPAMALDYCMELKGELSAGTYNKHVDFLKALYHVLKHVTGIDCDPFGEIDRETANPVSKRVLTADELVKVVTTAQGEMRTLFLLGTFTALRLGDCVTLKWSEVDFTKRLIVRIPNKTKRNGKTKPIQAYMPDEMLVDLKAHRKRVKGAYVFPELNRVYNRDGARQDISKGIQKHFRACGIETAAKTEGPRQRTACEVGFHSLRHTFITRQAEAGVNPLMIAAQVGHSSLDTTSIYVHASGETAKRLAGNLPSLTGDEAITVYDLPGEVMELLEGMNGKNWKQTRDRILEAAS